MRRTPVIKALGCLALLGAVACTTAPFSTGQGDESSSLRIDPGATLIHKGQSVQLRAVLSDPADRVLSADLVLWSSSNPSVADVSSGGMVTGLSAGSAQVTAIYRDQAAAVSIGVVDAPACASALQVPEGCFPPQN